MTDNSDSATLVGVTEVDTATVSKGGQLFVGKAYAGKNVKYAIRVEEATETTESEVEGTAD